METVLPCGNLDRPKQLKLKSFDELVEKKLSMEPPKTKKNLKLELVGLDLPRCLEDTRRSNEHFRVSQALLEILNTTRVPKDISVGVEVEFFLRDQSSHKLCDLNQSQLFLFELSKLPGWIIFLKNDRTKKILRVSRNVDEKRYHSIKYEHPPHMMEAAIAYETDLNQLYSSLTRLFIELHQAAKSAGVMIDISLKVEPRPICWDSVREIETRFEPLSLSRKKIFETHNENMPDHRIDFTTFTAATQIHVGGRKWWEQHPDFMDQLYRSEFLISGMAYQGSKLMFHERWSNYRYVFGNMPLLGFPRLAHWSFNQWVEEFLNTPIFEQKSMKFFDSIDHFSHEEIMKHLRSIRDLQIIKPKWIGTLEYRSDPAISDIKLIMQLASMRLGAYLHALSANQSSFLNGFSFQELSTQWWEGLHVTEFSNELENLKTVCHEALSKRTLGEERFL